MARSTFPSQNVQNTAANTAAPDHFWKLRCRKSARCCGAKQISKSKCTKHTRFGPLLEVEMSKKGTPLWCEAHFQVKMLKAPGVRTTTFRYQMSFRVAGARDCAHLVKSEQNVTVLYHFQLEPPLHHTTLQYTTLQLQLHLHYIPLHYTQLHSITLQYITLHYIPLHYTILHYTTLHNITLHYTTLHYTTTTLHSTTLHYTTLHYTTLHSTTTTLHYIPLHATTLHSTTLNWMTLHYTYN